MMRLERNTILAPGLRPVAPLAFGCLPCRLAERAKWHEMMDFYYESGGNLFDTSRMYGAGESEQVLGEWLETCGTRAQTVLVTKCGHGGSLALLPDEGFEEMVTRELTASLSALRTDHVDLLLLHRDNPVVAVSRIMERLNQEARLGTVTCIGASNWTYQRVDDANAYASSHELAGFSVVSNHLSLATASEPFYPRLVNVDAAGEAWHTRTRIPLLSWSAAARGFFTGAFQPGLPAVSEPFGQRMLAVYGSAQNYGRLSRAEKLGVEKGGYTATQVALAWLLHRPYVVIPVIGPRSLSELRDCLAVTQLALSERECAWLEFGE